MMQNDTKKLKHYLFKLYTFLLYVIYNKNDFLDSYLLFTLKYNR